MRSGANTQRTTLPSFSQAISLAFSSTCICFMNPASDMPCGAARSLTLRAPPASASSVPRRAGCERAPNTRSRSVSSYLTIRLSFISSGNAFKCWECRLYVGSDAVASVASALESAVMIELGAGRFHHTGHLTVSRWIRLASDSGLPGATSRPSAVNFSRTSGRLRTRAVSALMRASTPFGRRSFVAHN